MASEIRTVYPSGSTLYAILGNRAGEVAHLAGEAFETEGASGHTFADYAIALTDMGWGYYVADMPSWVPADTLPYVVGLWRQTGANPVEADDSPAGGGDVTWTGSAEAESAVTEIGAETICNMALAMLGGGDEDQQVVSLYDGSPMAALCQVYYPLNRNEVLRIWPYNEVRKYVELGAALTGSSEPEKADWEYVFTLPADYVAMVNLLDQDNKETVFPYAIRNGYFFCDDLTNTDRDTAYIEYIFREVNVTKYSPELIRTIATKLAIELAPIIKDMDTAAALEEKYQLLILPDGIGHNAEERHNDNYGEYSWSRGTDPDRQRLTGYRNQGRY